METRVDIAWCPGCGNFAIRDVLEKAFRELPIPQNQIVLTSGIGQAAKMPHYLEVNYFDGLHGRSLPLAVGIKLARPDLTVIAYSGDGCMYGEGGNHFIQTIRRRLDITIMVSDNQVYALTKGQSYPTTGRRSSSRGRPWWTSSSPASASTRSIPTPGIGSGSSGWRNP